MPINGKNSIIGLFYAVKNEDGTYSELQPIKATTLKISSSSYGFYIDKYGIYNVDDKFFNIEEA